MSLKLCKNCQAMTNHENHVCLKCKPAKEYEKCKRCKGTGEEPDSENKEYNGLSCFDCNGMGELKLE